MPKSISVVTALIIITIFGCSSDNNDDGTAGAIDFIGQSGVDGQSGTGASSDAAVAATLGDEAGAFDGAAVTVASGGAGAGGTAGVITSGTSGTAGQVMGGAGGAAGVDGTAGEGSVSKHTCCF